jgi:uncharacterized glyoxalase superfamily protein PhnB
LRNAYIRSTRLIAGGESLYLAQESIMPVVDRATTVLELWPLLHVADIERSVAFYHSQLGFDVVGEAQSGGRVYWCRLKRGGASLMLQQADGDDGPSEARGRGVAFYFVCDAANVMHAELTAHGMELDPPSTAYYRMKQLVVPEPDGYSVCFESQIGRV